MRITKSFLETVLQLTQHDHALACEEWVEEDPETQDMTYLRGQIDLLECLISHVDD